MHGEPAHAQNDPGETPLPPVTTRWTPGDGADPGSAGVRLGPFRPGFAHTAAVESEFPAVEAEVIQPEPEPATIGEPAIIEAELMPVESEPAEVELDAAVLDAGEEMEEPVVAAAVEEMGLDMEPVPEPVEEIAPWEGLPESDYYAVAPQHTEVEIEPPPEAEEPWLLPADAVVEEEPWASAPAEAEATASTADVPAAELTDEIAAPVPSLDTVPEHQQWDALGDALKSAVAWDEGADAAAQAEPAGSEAEPATATTADPYAGELADRLHALAERLRAKGSGAIVEAIGSSDRLEASLALFLAGYQAGRGH